MKRSTRTIASLEEYPRKRRFDRTPEPPPPEPSTAQRLQELETLRAMGTISDAEYTAKRQEIIAAL